jgi:hypothetical protein
VIDKRGHEKKASGRGRLTSWRAQSDGQMRSRKEGEQAMSTHSLESAERRTSKDTERKRASEDHSLPGERKATIK